MKEEHRQSLLNGETLECPTGYLIWFGKSGYFNCKDPDCLCCEDGGLTWEDGKDGMSIGKKMNGLLIK